MKHLISITIALVIVLVSYIFSTHLVEKYIKDTQCISTLISQGIERKDIHQEDGICIIEDNAYYKYK